MKSGVSPQKTPIWASIYIPVAPSQLISSGHSPHLEGGHKQSFGGEHRSGMPPRIAGSEKDPNFKLSEIQIEI